MRNYRNQRTIIATNNADFVLASLQEAKDDFGGVEGSQVKVQDMLLSPNRRQLLPVACSIAASYSHPSWEFVDCVPLKHFSSWQKLCHCMITTRCQSTVVQANVEFPEGSSAQDLQDFLLMLPKDSTIKSIAFAGALYGYHQLQIPQELCKLMKQSKKHPLQLQDDIVIQVSCGPTQMKEEHNWRKLVQDCSTALKSLVRTITIRSSISKKKVTDKKKPLSRTRRMGSVTEKSKNAQNAQAA